MEIDKQILITKWKDIPLFSFQEIWYHEFKENGLGESYFYRHDEGRIFPIISVHDWKYEFIEQDVIKVEFEDKSSKEIKLTIEPAKLKTYKRNDDDFCYVYKFRLKTDKFIFPDDANFPFEDYEIFYSEFYAYSEKQEIEDRYKVKSLPIEKTEGFDLSKGFNLENLKKLNRKNND